MTSYATVVLSLIFVVGLMYALGFLLKKIGFTPASNQDHKTFQKTVLSKGYAILNVKQNGQQYQLLETPSGICMLSDGPVENVVEISQHG